MEHCNPTRCATLQQTPAEAGRLFDPSNLSQEHIGLVNMEAFPDLIVYCDGASRGNPGPAAFGIVITTPDGRELLAEGRAVGTATSNQAEYLALERALQLATQFQPRRVEVRLDSELLVRQMNGQYRVRSPHLAPLHARVQELVRRMPDVRFVHVPRGRNARADELANAALDQAARRQPERRAIS
jgi:ribonuclease HI